MQSRAVRKRGGFTLIELIAVIVIIGLIAMVTGDAARLPSSRNTVSGAPRGRWDRPSASWQGSPRVQREGRLLRG